MRRDDDAVVCKEPRSTLGGGHVEQHSRTDAYTDRYAARAAGMVASEIRALFAVAARPEVVSLAGGMPYVSALPLDTIGQMAGDLIARNGAEVLQYGSAQGDPVLRERICEVMSLEGIQASADDVVVTVGAQQALDLITRIFVDPGDVVLAEAPSYVGALGTFASYQADVVHVPLDEGGLIPSALTETLERLEREGRRVKFLYTVPTFQNPAGVTLTPARRAQILEICARYDVLIIEDNPYGLLGFDGEPMRALRADDSERVIYLGSFSKTIASGLRVGWALAPHAIRAKLVLAAESAVLCQSSFTQLAVREYLTTQPWREQIKDFRELYRERRDAMLESLTALMPEGCTWTNPAGGFFVWLTLPEGLDSKAMAPRAIAQRVAYVPGTGFYADGTGHRHMRISYCYPEPHRIREGVRRLAGVIEAELQLRDTFGGTGGLPTLGVDTPGPDTV
jgi:DNA-binding transcriptional MocR family regulator